MCDYKELVKILRACTSKDAGCMKCPRQNAKSFANDCAMSAVRDAADAIEELLAAVPKWISVDRNNLPGHEVIAVNAKPGSYGYKEMLVGMVFYSEEERFFACESDDGIILVNVTHYMEKPSLPHPPKGVE